MPLYDNIIIRLQGDQVDQQAAFAGLKRLEGEVKRRVHQQGKGSDERPLGTFAKSVDDDGFYSKQHGRLRRKRGRRTSPKDLQLTGGLIRSYTVGTNKGRYVFGFLTDKSRLIAVGQEEQTRTRIFGPSSREIDNMLQIYAQRLVNDIFK